MAVWVCRKVGLRALHDFFHRQVRGEREAQLLAILFRAEAEIAIESAAIDRPEAISCNPPKQWPFFAVRARGPFSFWHAIEKRGETFPHEIDCACVCSIPVSV